MVRITEDLIRKRAEHNDCELGTLEEVSLHQQDIERIEYIDKWCRNLKILYFQNNLIPKIENVSRLKQLEYLNLALNNIERVENLEGCESLKKLDLTVNFVGELNSITCLRGLTALSELFFTGNPCTEYTGYRQYVIATLPQLKYLDGTEIEKSERILAIQNYSAVEGDITIQQEEYRKKREKQKTEANFSEDQTKQPGFDGRWYTDINSTSNNAESDEKKVTQNKEKSEKDFWNEKMPYTPESRIQIYEHMKKVKEQDELASKKSEKQKRPRRLFAEDGRPFNVNEPKIDFCLNDEEENNAFVLDLACYRFLDTSLIDVDVQPHYVRATIKGKIFQLSLPAEVNVDSSTAKRSQTTGHLLITMPKMKAIVKPQIPLNKLNIHCKQNMKPKQTTKRTKEEKLEVNPQLSKTVDYSRIVKETNEKPLRSRQLQTVKRENSKDFVDNPDVPPLI